MRGANPNRSNADLAGIATTGEACNGAWLGLAEPRRINERLGGYRGRPEAIEVAMSEIIRMKSVGPVLHGVVKIVWLDGYEAIVDLRPVIPEGDVFEPLRGSPELFASVKLAEFGHAITWFDNDGDEIDFGSDQLRRRAERQAEILRLAS
jgi:Protein of unknown function (DUF2442)